MHDETLPGLVVMNARSIGKPVFPKLVLEALRRSARVVAKPRRGLLHAVRGLPYSFT